MRIFIGFLAVVLIGFLFISTPSQAGLAQQSAESAPAFPDTGETKIFLPQVLNTWSPWQPILIDDFEGDLDWFNSRTELKLFTSCADAAVGDFSFCFGGLHKSQTWVGEAQKFLNDPQDWRSYNALQVWIKGQGTPSRDATPYISITIRSRGGGLAYLHLDTDTCIGGAGGGWRTPVENSDWQLYTFPLRQDNPGDCQNLTTIDWDRVCNINIELRTGPDTSHPADVYIDHMIVTRVPAP